MLKQLQIFILLLFLAGFIPDKAFAQFPYNESFMNSTSPGMNLGGTASLTSGTGSDAVGNGYLRLTNIANSQAGYVYSSNSFPSSKGISVSFEYYTYGGNGADGISFFLYDATTPTFSVGSYGGGLGYTNITSTGLSNGYLGIGLDEYGNFSDPSAGGNGGPGRVTNSVTIRGAYNDPNGAYAYLTTVPVQANYNFPIGSSGSTRPTSGGSGYRKAYINIIPHAGSGYDITVKIQHDAVSAPVTVINNYYYNKAAPANLKFGYAASTGGSTNYHEIRNVGVTLPASTSVVAPTQTNQTLSTCSNSTGSVNISSGFSTTNSPNGAINTASVDLNPSITGIQTTYPVANKGTFTSDGSGNITFTPSNSMVTGTASCNFTVADNYGATSNTAIVTATINAVPVFTITNPAAVCSPATVDLTTAAITAGSDANLTLSYYNDAAATTVLSNPNAVATSGTYYIKAVNANGCSVVQPVSVTINPAPTTANAGTNQTITAATPASATLAGNTATVGTGMWSQISGPTAAAFANTALSNTNVSNLNPGNYVFRWTITNSCSTSYSNVMITVVGTQSINFAAFPAKVYGDADFNLSANATSGLSVVYTSSDPNIATVDAAGIFHILAAGSVTVTASQPGNSNYSAATAVTQIISINKASLTIAASNQNTTYGTVPALTLTYAGFVNGENSTSLTTQPNSSTTATAASAVGTYPITVGGAASNNYTIAYTQGTLTIGQSAQTISFNALSAKTYGDPDFTLTATAASGLPVTYTSSNPSVATVDAQGVVSILSAGTTVITASQAGNNNYTPATTTQTLAVNKASLIITADNLTKTYNTANPALTISYSGFVNGETSASLITQPTISTTATATSAVGNYPVTISGAASNNYAITNANGVLAVTQSTPAIAFNALPAKVYGDADFGLAAVSSSGLPVSYTSSNPTVATVDAQGRVHILSAGTTTITASQNGNNNYNAAPTVAQILTINKASLTITADNKTKTYGADNPVFTISYSGLIDGETSANLNTLPTISTTATTTSAVGTYPITVSGASAANYQITYVNGALSVYPGTQTITFTASPKTYGDPDFTLNAVASSGLPVTYSSSNPAVATVDADGLVHIVAAGNVTISALQTGNGNYIATTVINQQLTINRATLTVVADNVTKTFGSANPPLTISYSGFVNGDTSTSLTTQPTISTTATTASEAGLYPILVSGAVSANYRINYQSGSLIVERNTQQTTFAALPAKTYGDADFTLNASTSSGLPLTFISSDSTIATVDAMGQIHLLASGVTTITALQAGNSNYLPADSVQQILVVNKASLTVTADAKTITYGSVVPAFTFSYTGFVNGETASVLTATPIASTTVTATSPAGTYPIVASGAAAANYTITYADGTLTVSKAALTITADDKTRAYGLPNPDFTLTYNGFVNGETTSVLSTQPTAATTATTSSTVGTYPITVANAAADNYSITYVSGTLTISNATVNSVSLAQVTLLENQASGTTAGTLSAVSLDPNAVYTYSLISGTGSADNASFAIQGNKIVAAHSFDFEQKASYSILVRATNQYGLYADQAFIIQITDVNEAPTLAAIQNQMLCYSASAQKIGLSGITAGPEPAQNTTLSISSNNPAMFSNLSVSSVSGGSANVNYSLNGTGTAVITVVVKDDGGTANGGTDSFSQSFTLTANDLPVAAITADKSTQITKGQTVMLTASGGSTYSWDNSAGIVSATNTALLQVRPAQTTTYQVSVSNASGCSSTASITINVADDYSSIQAANILTPNGDGKNDTWIVKNIDMYPESTIIIFDKGGRKLLNVKHYNNDWDGTYQGSPLAEGTYYYVIDFGAGKAPLKGFITIIRNR